jgi:hypothetical protein
MSEAMQPCVCGHPRRAHHPDFDSDWCDGDSTPGDHDYHFGKCKCRDFMLAYDEEPTR